MKNSIKFTLYFFAALLVFVACEDYLEKTPDADLTEDDIFNNYAGAQGFLDRCYNYMIDLNSHALTTGSENGDHSVAFEGWSSANKFWTGNYWEFLDRQHSNYWTNDVEPYTETEEEGSGIWVGGWRGIRVANIVLEKLPLLTGATTEQKKVIEGQAYFFRAYFHWEIITRWGGVPYVNVVFGPEDDMKWERPTFNACVDSIVSDMDKAAELLPKNWDQTPADIDLSGIRGSNYGRATKGAALAYKAKALLYAGSPLMNGVSTGKYAYDEQYLEKAALAFADFLELVDEGYYDLVPWEDMQSVFARKDGEVPWTKETIFQKITSGSGDGLQTSRHGRLYTPARFGGNGICETPTQNLVDLYEMVATGLPISDPASGYNENNPWNGRDPRFDEFILTDGDLAGYDIKTKVEFYVGGVDDIPNNVTSYMTRKYWPRGVNSIDKDWSGFKYATPMIRLADVYLMYAEAVNELYGPTGTAGSSGLTAIDAVNKVRQRAGMLGVNAKYTGSKELFRERIWNERAVELCFEGARWMDIRRWYVAHENEYKKVVDLVFDQNHTSFKRVELSPRIFDLKHYWMPFPVEQTQLYPEWTQNPGW